MAAVWPREAYVTGGGAAEVALIALAPTRLPDPLPVSRARHGMPDDGDGPMSVSIVARDRETDPAWFAERVLAPFAQLIAEDLGDAAEAIARSAAHAYVIEAKLDDPDDLGHVQAAWALAKCVCECAAEDGGAAIVIDVFAARAHLGEEVASWSATRPFDVLREVTLFFDEQPDGSLAAWSLGLRKVGRPDLVLLGISPGGEGDAALLLRDVAQTLSAGERIEPGDQLDGPTGAVAASAFDPASAPGVPVEAPALLLQRLA